MPREPLFPLSTNEQQFLFYLAASKQAETTIPDLLRENGLDGIPRAHRAFHSTATILTGRGITDDWLVQLEPEERTGNSNGLVRVVCLTERGADTLFAHIEQQAFLLRAAKRGLRKKFDF